MGYDVSGLEIKTLEDPAHELGHRKCPELQIDWRLKVQGADLPGGQQ